MSDLLRDALPFVFLALVVIAISGANSKWPKLFERSSDDAKI